jgi:resuscitation-promoting factor RpfA
MPAKHRAPSPATTRLRTTVVATTTGPLALAALGAVAAAPAAQASPSVDWDAVAQCESSGNWATDTGNGFFGGLQFTQSTWKAFGGSGTPQNASREQQIAVAEKVLDGQGIKAWPVCGPKGLGGHTSNASSGSSSSGSHSSSTTTSGGSHRSTTTPRSAPTRDSGGDYTVVSGDTLSSIASAHGVSGGWQSLAAANQDVSTNPNMIMPGQHLVMPGGSST